MKDIKHIFINSVKLSNFRNYESLSIDPINPKNNIIFGKNGAGKTNVLEALSLLSSGSGLRNSKLNDLGNINFNEKNNLPKAWSINFKIIKDKEEIKINTGYYYDQEIPNEKRIIKIDDEELKNQNDLANLINIVHLTPQMDKLFLESSEKRRRFFDKLISDFDPKHSKRLNQYKSAMAERSYIIKRNSPDHHWLNAIEENIVSCGIAVSASRIDFIKKLNTIIKKRTSHFPKITIEPIGEIENLLLDNPAYIVEEKFKTILKESRKVSRSGLTESFDGSHKFDFNATYIEKKTPARIASTGEQKSIIIAVIFGYAELIKYHKGINPILLLDEIPAHLDIEKQTKLFEEIKALNTQTFYTGVFKDSFKNISSFFKTSDLSFYEISEGKIV